eukprot:COSAG02_NODE_329_length_24516_cov_11.403448_9_plen_238_part_00
MLCNTLEPRVATRRRRLAHIHTTLRCKLPGPKAAASGKSIEHIGTTHDSTDSSCCSTTAAPAGRSIAARSPADNGQLSEQQVAHFHTFGFLKLPQLLRPDELLAVQAEFAAGLVRKDKNDRIAGPRLQLNWTNLDAHSPAIQALLEDNRFFGVAQQLLGDDCIGFDSNCNFYSGDRSPWHPDVGPDLVGLKFTMYLTEVGANSGALCVCLILLGASMLRANNHAPGSFGFVNRFAIV